MHEELKIIQITRQYGVGRSSVDLMVGNSVILELKYNLNSTSELQRLKGQLTEYKQWEKNIIIVLCGQTDPNFKKDLTQFIDRELSSITILDNIAVILDKA